MIHRGFDALLRTWPHSPVPKWGEEWGENGGPVGRPKTCTRLGADGAGMNPTRIDDNARSNHEPASATTELPRFLYTQDEAAQMLSISIRLVQDLTAMGRLPCRRIGRAVRYTQDDLRSFVDSLEDQPYG